MKATSPTEPIQYGTDWKLAKRVLRDGEYWTGVFQHNDTNLPVAAAMHAITKHGYTLILNRAQSVLPNINRAAWALEEALGWAVSVNIYVTPPGGSQGFEVGNGSNVQCLPSVHYSSFCISSRRTCNVFICDTDILLNSIIISTPIYFVFMYFLLCVILCHCRWGGSRRIWIGWMDLFCKYPGRSSGKPMNQHWWNILDQTLLGSHPYPF